MTLKLKKWGNSNYLYKLTKVYINGIINLSISHKNLTAICRGNIIEIQSLYQIL